MSEHIERIKELSGLLLTPAEIAIVLEIDVSSFTHQVNKKDSEFYKAYHQGRLSTKIELRKNLVSLMKKGSPQAELLINDLLKNDKTI